ncbi:Putative DnaJ domain, Sec63 domain, immunoglobulin E-set, C2 domain superfamily [Colletotrichum destructivum]|uniref:DnaJ domain, Sec63 domain, immunoglobulin E-set, C2 domain superfamily n=1 Tax=Colletotrichum destructivum TaxID=34406 RepID=A0AAX4HZQ8_9PEZI|nr:Putative DnaJ domain, Sec63 domain, immunoglobulin E-set, C2 domain superfamily [Colletotrichum destructivum]
MSSDYSYDAEAQFYPFFILAISSIITLPLGYTLVFPSKDIEAKAPRIQSDFKPEHVDLIDKQRKAHQKKQRRIVRVIAVFVGLAVMAGMIYLIIHTKTVTQKIWNPYDILGISDSADEKTIKKVYKQLSRRLHPDKVKPDPAKNETIESLNDAYVEISKAYQALTDEEIRNNFIQYGHPDGKQSFSIGIALPQFMISDGNGKYVVLAYTLLLGVLLPYLVGSWWYGTQRMSKDGVLMESANNLFRAYDDNVDEGGVITALSSGKEFDAVLKGDKAESGLSKLESKLLANAEKAGLSQKDRQALEDLDSGVRRKALALLWSYLGRVELEDSALDSAKYEVAPIAHALTRSFSAIAQAYGSTGPILAAYSTSQHLIQALPPKASPLLQLPHFSQDIVRQVEGGDSKVHVSLQQFMDLPDDLRRNMVVRNKLLSEDQYKSAVSVARQLPQLRVAKAFFKVTGERFIIPSSLVTLVVKGRIVPPGSENVPEINELDLEDIDPPEDDLEAYLGRKKKTVKGPDGQPIPVDDKPILPPLAHAPYFARDHAPKWYVFLTDSKQGKMAVPPFTFTQFDQPIFGEDGKPTFNMQTLKAQFAAPPQAGHYTFVMHVVCDSYVGFDTKMEVTLVVEEASKAAAMVAEDDISEPDEDSIAGQMQALKGGSVPGATKPRRKVEEDSDEESGTDDDVEDDTSETNTDTEDES